VVETEMIFGSTPSKPLLAKHHCTKENFFMQQEVIATTNAPSAIGPYSQAIRAGKTLYLSGQIALDPQTGEMQNSSVEAELHQIFQNMKAVLTAAGSDFTHVVKLTVYLIDFNDFPILNTLMQEVFAAPFPARTTIAVSALPKQARVEIDAIVVMD
jgi:2-iminobutanoate/2-iminopropanoate deaminase